MEMTPKEIVEQLDKYIIGQQSAKRAVAIALRNRYRRSQLSKELRDEITPKNIIMKGPTGVGKTEIARRLAKLVNAPFVKAEATKYTEVGYVGRDVESMIRDLVSVSIRLVKEEKEHQVESKAKIMADDRIIKVLLQVKNEEAKINNLPEINAELLKEDYFAGKFENMAVDIDITEPPKEMEISGMEGMNLTGFLQGFIPRTHKKKKLKICDARKLMIIEEAERLIDQDSVNTEAIRRAEEEGIVFIDEIDKVVGKNSSSGPDVSREGVQRDILPIIEGSTVSTKYGNIKTDYILFIASGAFHVSKIEDMIPELQGRFPIRVELSCLSKQDFVKILTQPKNAITMQYAKLLEVDNIKLEFTDDAIDEIAEMAFAENETSENIGARRLNTVMEALLEDISYNASGQHPMLKVQINKEFVQNAFSKEKKKYDLKKYIL
ncbi:MAG: ATP-dependent protease ATPase subunit HslU [Clostridia bacterium]